MCHYIFTNKQKTTATKTKTNEQKHHSYKKNQGNGRPEAKLKNTIMIFDL